MSIKIGCGWSKTTENGGTYISIALNKEILQLYPQLQGLSITAFHTTEAERRNEKSPHWAITISVPPEKKAETEEEIPFN